MAGAFGVIDLHLGKVCDAQSFRIPNRGLGLDTSTLAEAETATQGLRSSLKIIEDLQLSGHKEDATITVWTDNQSVVAASNTHVLEDSTINSFLKSKITNQLRNLRRLKEMN